MAENSKDVMTVIFRNFCTAQATSICMQAHLLLLFIEIDAAVFIKKRNSQN